VNIESISVFFIVFFIDCFDVVVFDAACKLWPELEARFLLVIY